MRQARCWSRVLSRESRQLERMDILSEALPQTDQPCGGIVPNWYSPLSVPCPACRNEAVPRPLRPLAIECAVKRFGSAHAACHLSTSNKYANKVPGSLSGFRPPIECQACCLDFFKLGKHNHLRLGGLLFSGFPRELHRDGDTLPRESPALHQGTLLTPWPRLTPGACCAILPPNRGTDTLFGRPGF